jgi:hypothetical protein
MAGHFPSLRANDAARLYTISKADHITRPPSIIDCNNDHDALERVKQLIDGYDIELWDGARFVARIKSETEQIPTSTS